MDAKADDGWRDCEGTWDRLRWARLAKGYQRAVDFAESINMKPGTYRTYERRPDSSKATALSTSDAIAFAKKLGVRWEWLLTGDGNPWAESASALAFPQKARLKKLADEVSEERAGALAEALEALLKAVR
jgi:transcriptional regulator with XRE-family HTH domain